ncbi:hypothetical protein CEUSTIGMA_g13395.t1 [Chlamydomonas eustigma]|uniref:MOSC domain-containing protein n=1 Tax=Chlamydomonas eustigma TaxID=1157962 RepID=A0A250XSP4_9CHLO|nr:hypothetical protein CEUSTIGMA_g13395.t1 [Chlamydomonas eustigma]|eukprot:GAX85979.1 hypothetical protein CEUSTIGMA_g13395.t1 [Chlamydomonas eustigma]
MHISALYVYPIKSARGVACPSATLTSSGLSLDRLFMVTRSDNGKFITARQIPKMALVVPSLPLEAFVGDDNTITPASVMVVNAPDMPSLEIPIVRASDSDEVLRSVTIWEWSGLAADEGDKAADWFSKFLGIPCRLTRYLGSAEGNPILAKNTGNAEPVMASTDRVRSADHEYAPDGFETRFSDGYPCLLANEASIQDLSARAGCDLPMSRFRPNIVVSGATPWDEDNWGKVFVQTKNGQQVEFSSVKPCSRCKMTTIDPETAEVGEEPLEILGSFRSGAKLGWDREKSWKHSVFFGWNVVSKQHGLCLSVGDKLEVQPQLLNF